MSDKNIEQQIKALLKDEMLKNTLVPQALQEMLDVLDANEIVITDLNDTINALNKNETILNKSLHDLRGRCGDVEKELAELKARVTNLDEREKACALTEIRNQFEKQRGDEFKEIIGMTLKNSEFRKTVFNSQPVAVQPMQYDNMGQPIAGQIVEHHETKVTTTEKEE